jgi:hypothetical protein
VSGEPALGEAVLGDRKYTLHIPFELDRAPMYPSRGATRRQS